MNGRLPVAALAAVLCTPAAGVAEDLTIVSTVTVGKGPPSTSTQYLSGDKVRTSDADTDTILEYGSSRMVVINHRKKEYYETSLAEMKRFLDQLQAQMQANPIMEKMLGPTAKVEVRKAPGSRKIAGYDTQQYVLSMGDTLKFDVWAAPALPAPHHYFEARKASYAAMGPLGKRFEAMFDEMKQIKGFPLALGLSARMMMFKQEMVSEATEVKKGPLPASAFALPAAYKKKDAPFKK
jgi:hypothetical protein